MKYISTRNSKKTFSFKDVFLNALAPDGGLFVPQNIPFFSIKELNELKKLSYNDLAAKIIIKFCSEEFEENELKEIVEKSYKSFRSKETVILKKYEDIYLLELFHGPTLAFKDIALQVIGNMYEKFLLNQKNKINIVVATSGDTGSAAINAIKGRNKLNIFVLHPQNKISEVQRKLMTTVKENNVFNIAVKGNFDDCQNLVKLMFVDNEFKNKINMSGVNSINWARIISQIVYYFYAFFKIEEKGKKINFSVPTGNFGDVYAGYISKRMGLPINKLIVATNRNDILKRVINTGEYKIEDVVETISPSMDIQVASNFERLIFDINSNDDLNVKEKMKNLKEQKFFRIDKNQLKSIKQDFVSESLSEKETQNFIKNFYNKFKIILDPHTAVGYGVLNKISSEGINVVLATAHPCKFPEAINKAIGLKPNLPKELDYIMSAKENYDLIPNNLDKIKNHILEKI
jgi:threonine synthase